MLNVKVGRDPKQLERDVFPREIKRQVDEALADIR